jgi:hypothetical protein
MSCPRASDGAYAHLEICPGKFLNFKRRTVANQGVTSEVGPLTPHRRNSCTSQIRGQLPAWLPYGATSAHPMTR